MKERKKRRKKISFSSLFLLCFFSLFFFSLFSSLFFLLSFSCLFSCLCLSFFCLVFAFFPFFSVLFISCRSEKRQWRKKQKKGEKRTIDGTPTKVSCGKQIFPRVFSTRFSLVSLLFLFFFPCFPCGAFLFWF